MFKALLLSIWYDLSDVKLAEALDDRDSFRRFCGFSGTEATPERTAYVRFRKALIAHGLDRLLFETVTAQLKAKAITVKTGTLVDATIIASASEDDGDARPKELWGSNTGESLLFTASRALLSACKAVEGHMLALMPIPHWSKRLPLPLPISMTAGLALMRCPIILVRSLLTAPTVETISAKLFVPREVSRALSRAGMWGRDEAETLQKLKDWNQPIHRLRGRTLKNLRDMETKLRPAPDAMARDRKRHS